VLTRNTFAAILPVMGDSGSQRRPDRRCEPLKPLEWQIVEFAVAQHGVVALWQLVELGLSARAVRDRVAVGRLHRIHEGVYAVGHPRLTKKGVYMAAVLACGRRSALSHRSAADHRELWRGSRDLVDVISPRRPGRKRAGIDAHTSSTLLLRDIETIDGIPCTSVARTLLDLAAVVPRRRIERAVDEAEYREVLDAAAIEDVLARAGHHRGAGVLRAILDDHAPGSTRTRNELEEAFLAICDRVGLPRPEVNAWIALEPNGYEADFLWRAQRFIAETDGGAAHATRRGFENDRRRDQRLTLAGYRVVRFTYSQVFDEPRSVETTISELLRKAA
jgi:predicted transcriptional regulator of viral defense system